MRPLFQAACAAIVGFVAPLYAWSQATEKSTLVEHAYVSIVPAGETDVDSVMELQRGIEIVLCQSGVKQRLEEAGSGLKLSASLMKADLVTQPGQVLRECELTEAAVTLPDGARIPLPDLAISSRLAGGRRSAADSFFTACGATFARNALDALKGKIALRGSSCNTRR